MELTCSEFQYSIAKPEENSRDFSNVLVDDSTKDNGGKAENAEIYSSESLQHFP
jgi:hypothetical protein